MSVTHRTVFNEQIPELTTPRITFQIVDEAGTGFEPSTLTLTLYNVKTGAMLNSRDHQNVVDAAGVTVDAQGQVVWQTSAEDMAILVATESLEVHVALLEWSWSLGTKHGKHELEFHVRNLTEVPA